MKELNCKDLMVINGGYRENNPGGGGNFAFSQNARVGRNIARDIANQVPVRKKRKRRYRPSHRLGGYCP